MDHDIRTLERATQAGDEAAATLLARMYARMDKRPMLRLTDYMRNADKPKGDDEHYWFAGSQLSALAFYLDTRIERRISTHDNDYQGSVYALMVVPTVPTSNSRYVLLS